MCGRATLTVSPEDLEEAFGLDERPTLIARYNIAPSQELAALKHAKHRRVEMVRWGLQLPNDPRAHVNVRSEQVATNTMYRESFASRRCVCLVDGFYEWARGADKKTPYWIHREDHRPFALAAIWHATDRETCAILTTRAVGAISGLHDRMPVIIPIALIEMYLAGTRDEAHALCVPNDDGLVIQEVSTLVNRPANEGPQLLAPPDAPLQRSLF